MGANPRDKSLCQRLFKKKWKDFTTSQRITWIAALLAVSVSLLVWLWPNNGQPTLKITAGIDSAVGAADSNGTAMVVDGRDNVAVAPGGTYIGTSGLSPEWLAERSFEYAERAGRAEAMLYQSEREEEQLKKELNAALQRVENLHVEGHDDAATEAITQYRESGDTAMLLEVLIRERDHHSLGEASHRAERIRLSREVAAVAYLKGDVTTAKQAIDEILALEPNDVFALTQRAQIHLFLGSSAEAKSDYLRALELADDDEGRATAWGGLGNVYLNCGDPNKAEQMYRKVLQVYEEGLAPTRNMSISYGNLAVVYGMRGDLDQAENMNRKALEIDEELGQLEGLAIHYGNLGTIYRTRGDLDQAERTYLRALQANERLGRVEGMATIYANLGAVYAIRGNLDQAEQMYRRALELNEKLGRPSGIANDYSGLGIIYRGRGDLDKAEEMHRKALEIAEEIGWLEGVSTHSANLANVYHARGDLDQAEQLHRKALEIDNQLGLLEGLAIEYANLGNVYLSRRDVEQATQMYHKALEIDQKIQRVQGIAHDYLNLGMVLKICGDSLRAREYWEKSLSMFTKLGMRSEVQHVQRQLDALRTDETPH